MVAHENVPDYARLKSGVTEKDILEAVVRSGYPLQATVAEIIKESLKKANFFERIQEEWAYVDKDSGNIRALDVFVDAILLSNQKESKEAKNNVVLNTLVECKQSDLPYIFFLREDPPKDSVSFPEIFGTAGPDVRVFKPLIDKKSPPGFSYLMSVHDVLACYDFEIFNGAPFHAISFTKAARRKGSSLGLTGEEAYRSVTLPLLKAVDHLKEVSDSGAEEKSGPIRIVAPFAVFDAPMVGVIRHEGKNILMALPWVRVSYLEPFNDQIISDRASSKVRYFDIVHVSYLDKYLELLIDGIKGIANRVIECDSQLKEGFAVIDEGEGYRRLESLEDDRRKYLQEKPAGRIERKIGGASLNFQEGVEIPEGAILILGDGN